MAQSKRDAKESMHAQVAVEPMYKGGREHVELCGERSQIVAAARRVRKEWIRPRLSLMKWAGSGVQ